MSTVFERLAMRLFNQTLVPSERFSLGFVNATCPERQLFATAEITSGGKNEEIAGASIYVIEAAEAENDNARFYAGVLGSAFKNDTTRFKVPLALGISLFPWDPRADMEVIIMVGISRPDRDEMDILYRTVTVKRQGR